MQCFVDMDGVLADFDRHVQDLFGFHPRQIPDDDLWVLVQSLPDFWLTIPVKHGARDLWSAVQPYTPVILTGCPRSHYDLAAAHKVTWAKQHFGDTVNIITCLSRNKAQYLQSTDDILIDDRGSNVRRWRKAGGRAIYYRTAAQTLVDLELLLHAKPD